MEENNLTCPITMELFEDPISTPCGHTFSRLAFMQCFEVSRNCPVCRTSLDDFNPETANKNIIISNIVDEIRKPPAKPQNPSKNAAGNQWSCEMVKLSDVQGNELPFAELRLSLENSTFSTRPNLFILVLDESGSMAGNPIKQAQDAIIHIFSIAQTNSAIKIVLITYNGLAKIVKTDGDIATITQNVRSIQGNGSTNFDAAFTKIGSVLKEHIYSNVEEDQRLQHNIGGITIAFLTDGQAAGERHQLIRRFEEIINKNWTEIHEGPICVHTIGFGGECDRAFLEDIRKLGTVEGTFRYAEPQDDADTLCQKIQSLFDVVGKSSTVLINLRIIGANFLHRSDESSIQFPIGRDRCGTATRWVQLLHDDDSPKPPIATINSYVDGTVVIPIAVRKPTAIGQRKLMEKWISKITDDIASEVMGLAMVEPKQRDNVFDLHTALILQRIESLPTSVNLRFISEQVDALRSGSNAHLGKLSDLRFASQFELATIKSNVSSIKPVVVDISTAVPEPLKIKITPEWKEQSVKYPRNNRDTYKRTILQDSIVCRNTNQLDKHLCDLIDTTDVNHRDISGNSAVHLAAYCGQNLVLERILKIFPSVNVNLPNNDGETPITLAIKKGNWKIIQYLLQNGATLPDNRLKHLEKFAFDSGYEITSSILAGLSESGSIVSEHMSAKYVQFMYETAMKKKTVIDAQSYLSVALAKQMGSFAKMLIKSHNAVPTIDMLMKYCIPPKADHPDTDKYLELNKIVLESAPSLLYETNAEKETVLFKAAEKGSLPHVQYFLQVNSLTVKQNKFIDSANILGNTPLWIACAKAYPCIITELLKWGADVNYTNEKGNPPLYSLCQKGPKKIVEQLLAAKARCDFINKKTGDTLVLIACRNGQHEILRLLLEQVPMDFVGYRAHVDGFDAMMASAEADRYECIRALFDYGVSLETKTAGDNPILAGATPLHIAAYYNRCQAADKLLELGANQDSRDANGQTPLHIAVIQGNVQIIRLLRNAGANVGVRDAYDAIPASYCRDRTDIRKVLVNPALDILTLLAKGCFAKSEEKLALEVLTKYSGEPGFLTSGKAVDVIGADGSTPLIHAITHSTFPVAKTLIEIGADRNIRNQFGHTAYLYAKHIGNPRFVQLLSNEISPEITARGLKMLEAVAQGNPLNAAALSPVPRPEKIITPTSSEISARMESYINAIKLPFRPSEFLAIEPIRNASYNEPEFTNDIASINAIFSAKIFTVSVVASGKQSIPAHHILALNIYTSNRLLSTLINNAIIQSEKKITPYVRCIYESLTRLPNLAREVYVGANRVNRRLFMPQTEFNWSVFISSTTVWKVAAEHVSGFSKDSQKNTTGTIFIVQLKTGKYVGPCSSFPYDSEVIIMPSTKFVVKAWYRGDVICLGQANIREHTFGIKDPTEMVDSDKSLIIEIVEV